LTLRESELTVIHDMDRFFGAGRFMLPGGPRTAPAASTSTSTVTGEVVGS